MSTPIWVPTDEQRANSNIVRFMKLVNERQRTSLETYNDLHDWSVQSMGSFWREVWLQCGVVGEHGCFALTSPNDMLSARFFPDASLNFAENLLKRNDDADALVFWGEDRVRTRMTWRELQESVSKLAQALGDLGIGPGDRVAALMPNVPETVVAMLATTSLGAVWSSCSPDFGEKGILDRFGQIAPRVLFACDGYFYGGKTHDVLEKVAGVSRNLPSVEHVIVVPFIRNTLGEQPTTAAVSNSVLYDDLVANVVATQIVYARLPFNHPLYILFSSGTTGRPKCIVHSAGGTLLQHLKEHQLHSDIRRNDRLFYFTTCTWMMWNWLVSALASEATVMLFDGSPFHPNGGILFDYAEQEDITHFGVSAKYIDSLRKERIHPADTHDLAKIRFIASTGSPLVAENFDFVYEHIKSDVYLASISGGTDIVSCFVCGDPSSPLHRGEIACAGLGMAVEVWDESGKAVDLKKGELVCTKPFPAMPIGFWNDDGNKKYHSAYFERYANVWAQGDFAERTKSGGFVIHGRSDSTLNPGGVRIGTAEIYRQVEQIDDVLESIVIGQSWDGDVRVVLFVVLRSGVSLSEELVQKIRLQIRTGASPRHVPAKIVQVADIPRTKSGKITELAVREVVEGRAIKNQTALANPEALEFYKNVPELAS